MFVESSPIGYELSKDRLRRLAHSFEMASRYGDEPSEIVVALRAVRSALRAAKRALAHLCRRWIHLRPASHLRGVEVGAPGE